jgi:methionyl-tRNA formyltransferase
VAGWRIVLISQVPRAIEGMAQVLDALGHELVGVLAVRMGDRIHGIVDAVPATADLAVPATRERVAPLLASFEPDLTICYGCPWKIRPEALAVPRLGALNIHPSLLPRYRGPLPVSHALLNGDREIGLTIHRMDADFDTGPILAQASEPLDEVETEDALIAKLARLRTLLVPIALERVARGEEGEPQPADGASYAGMLGGEHAEVDWSRPALEIHRQVLAWRMSPFVGPFGEVEGRRVRLVRTRLDPDGGGVRVECGDGPLWVVDSEPA